ncbi:MAG TPA: hypothetical protein VG890_14565 [Puia sp.]|nr:hypothetical protein [Puia sp.]
MIKPGEMTTLSQVIETLRVRRMDNEFRFESEGMTIGNGKFYQPGDLQIIRTYRFEGESDPADSAILYLIEALDGTVGFIADTYGAYSNFEDAQYNDFIHKIKENERDEQQIFAD